VPSGFGSVIIEPGTPGTSELWSASVIETPSGNDFIAYSTDLSQYAQYFPQIINVSPSVREYLMGVLINGEPESLSALNNVPLGSLVQGDYVTQYFVSVVAPSNITSDWFNAGSSIVINEPAIINFNNGTRLVNPTLNGYSLPITLTVYNPTTLTITYTKQYLVNVSSIFGSSQTWINAGGQFTPNLTSQVVNGILFTPISLTVNGQAKPIGSLTINEPLSVAINYEASVNVSTMALGLPALYASATLKCGSAITTTSGYLTPSLSLSLINPPTSQCLVTESTIPLTPLVIVMAIIVIALIVKLNKR
jgi:hypothetical protein